MIEHTHTHTHKHPYLHYKAWATDAATQHGNTLTGAYALTTTRQYLATQTHHGNKQQYLHELFINIIYVRYDTPLCMWSRFTSHSVRGLQFEPFLLCTAAGVCSSPTLTSSINYFCSMATQSSHLVTSE